MATFGSVIIGLYREAAALQRWTLIFNAIYVLSIFALKKTRASGRNVGKVFNPVVKLVLENQPFLLSMLVIFGAREAG